VSFIYNSIKRDLEFFSTLSDLFFSIIYNLSISRDFNNSIPLCKQTPIALAL